MILMAIKSVEYSSPCGSSMSRFFPSSTSGFAPFASHTGPRERPRYFTRSSTTSCDTCDIVLKIFQPTPRNSRQECLAHHHARHHHHHHQQQQQHGVLDDHPKCGHSNYQVLPNPLTTEPAVHDATVVVPRSISNYGWLPCWLHQSSKIEHLHDLKNDPNILPKSSLVKPTIASLVIKTDSTLNLPSHKWWFGFQASPRSLPGCAKPRGGNGDKHRRNRLTVGGWCQFIEKYLKSTCYIMLQDDTQILYHLVMVILKVFSEELSFHESHESQGSWYHAQILSIYPTSLE